MGHLIEMMQHTDDNDDNLNNHNDHSILDCKVSLYLKAVPIFDGSTGSLNLNYIFPEYLFLF